MKDTSGAAFPNEITEEARLTKNSGRRCHELLGGMTLLQYYAGLAMQAMITSGTESMKVVMNCAEQADLRPSEMLAKMAHDHAEAMLAEYERRYD